MNGRFFDQRELKAYFWDGKTDYRILKESADELNKRIDDFGKWLEGDGLDEEEEEEEDE
jgi:hypothetical protein